MLFRAGVGRRRGPAWSIDLPSESERFSAGGRSSSDGRSCLRRARLSRSAYFKCHPVSAKRMRIRQTREGLQRPHKERPSKENAKRPPKQATQKDQKHHWKCERPPKDQQARLSKWTFSIMWFPMWFQWPPLFGKLISNFIIFALYCGHFRPHLNAELSPS